MDEISGWNQGQFSTLRMDVSDFQLVALIRNSRRLQNKRFFMTQGANFNDGWHRSEI